MGGYRPGWTLLAGEMHIPDASRPGYTRCGRQTGLKATIHRHRSGFDACLVCVDAPPASQPRPRRSAQASTSREPQPVPKKAHTPEQLAQFRRERDDLARARRLAGRSWSPRNMPNEPLASSVWGVLAGTWSVPAGWVVLPGTPVAHRPSPSQPGHVMCGRKLASEPVYRRRPRLPVCRHCTLARQQALAAERAVARDEGGQPPSLPEQAVAPPRPRMVRGGLPTLGRRR